MVEVAEGDADSIGSLTASYTSAAGAPRLRYRRLAPEEDAAGGVETCNILVMEYCDQASLDEAVRAMALHAQLPSGAVGVDYVGVVEVLLDVAYAVQYLHSMHLMHGDIKVCLVLFSRLFLRLVFAVIAGFRCFCCLILGACFACFFRWHVVRCLLTRF